MMLTYINFESHDQFLNIALIDLPHDDLMRLSEPYNAMCGMIFVVR